MTKPRRPFWSFLAAIIMLSHPLWSQRIITLAPALTEIVYALGGGDRIVGNTQFCDFPAAARDKVKIGGLADLNIELLVSLRPDLIIHYPEQSDRLVVLARRCRLVEVRHSTLKEILVSIVVIAEAMGMKSRGEALSQSISRELETKTLPTGKTDKKTVLVVVGRTGTDLKHMVVLGKQNFLDELLENAGGVNAYSGPIPYPLVSVESVIALDPEVILEISAHYEGINAREISEFWNRFVMIEAVKLKKVFFVKDDFWLRPGPRLGLVAGQLRHIIGHDQN